MEKRDPQGLPQRGTISEKIKTLRGVKTMRRREKDTRKDWPVRLLTLLPRRCENHNKPSMPWYCVENYDEQLAKKHDSFHSTQSA